METVSKTPSPKTPVALIFTGGARGCCGRVAIKLLYLDNQNSLLPPSQPRPPSFRLNFLAGRKAAGQTLREPASSSILSLLR